MKKETDQRELSPAELWDQLAVTTIKKQLAPTGYKKVYKGKSEVANIQFLGKQTVNQTCLIGANLVRLFRENISEYVKGRIEFVDQEYSSAMKQLDGCQFWQFKEKKRLKSIILLRLTQKGVLDDMVREIDTLKPSTPKAKKK